MNLLELNINTFGSLNQTAFKENIALKISNISNNETMYISFDNVSSNYLRQKYFDYALDIIIPVLILLFLYIIIKKLKKKLRSNNLIIGFFTEDQYSRHTIPTEVDL